MGQLLIEKMANKPKLPLVCCRKILSVAVFGFIVAAVSLGAFSFTRDTWWVGQLKVKLPLIKATKFRHRISISIRMRFGLRKTCWYIEKTKTDTTDVDARKFFAIPVRTCYERDKGSLIFESTHICVMVGLIFACLALILQLVNIIIGAAWIIKINIALCFLASVSIMAALITFNENVFYEASFMRIEMKELPSVILQNKQLRVAEKSVLELILPKLYRPRLRDKFMKGSAFMVLWVSEIFFITSFIGASLEYISRTLSEFRQCKQRTINSKILFRLPSTHSTNSMD